MARVVILNPGRLIRCDNCEEFEAGVTIRKVGDRSPLLSLCGRCLALAMQDITKQNWLSQWIVWQGISKIGKEIQERKVSDGTGKSDGN
jgi:hypothetical protein